MNQKEIIVQKISEFVFTKKNFNFTMDQLAKELKMSKKTFYKFFQTKYDLIDSIIYPKIYRIQKEISGIIEGENNFVEKCCLINEALIKNLKFAETLVYDLAKMGNDWWEKIDKLRLEILSKNLKLLLGQGISEGYIIDRDLSILTQIYISAISNVINPAFSLKVKTSPSKLAEITLEVLFKGIFTDKGRKDFKKLKQRK